MPSPENISPDSMRPPSSLTSAAKEKRLSGIGKSPFYKTSAFFLMLILLLAFVIRAVLIGYGLPLLLYEDEPIYYSHALGFGLGHWNIGYFKKPSFFLYSYGAVYYLGFLYSHFLNWKAYYNAFLQDPTYVATLGRSLSVIFATATILQMARLGKRAFGWMAGLAAAFWLAVDATHLRISPIVISDIPSLFFVITSALLALNVLEKSTLKDYLLCALSITLAASFKYNIFTVAFLLSAHVLGRWPELKALPLSLRLRRICLDKRLWLALFLIPVAFILLNPMLVMDFGTFLNHLNVEQKHMLARNPMAAKESVEFMAAFVPVFARILPRNLGWPIYLMGFAAIPWTLWRYRPQSVVVFSFMLLFLAVVLQFQLVNAKYLLPILAFWYLAVAVGLRDLTGALVKLPLLFKKGNNSSLSTSEASQINAERPQHSQTGPLLKQVLPACIFTVLVLLAALPNIVDVGRYVAVFTRTDTRQIAYRQITTSVQNGDRLFLEPNTLTMDNQIIRRQLVLSQFNRGQYLKISDQGGRLRISRQTLEAIRPRYVLIDYGMAKKLPSVQGHAVYQMPYSKAYYDYLQAHFRLKSTIAPYQIFLAPSEMEKILSQKGFETLYATIQAHKTRRITPGPSMLLLEKR